MWFAKRKCPTGIGVLVCFPNLFGSLFGRLCSARSRSAVCACRVCGCVGRCAVLYWSRTSSASSASRRTRFGRTQHGLVYLGQLRHHQYLRVAWQSARAGTLNVARVRQDAQIAMHLCTDMHHRLRTYFSIPTIALMLPKLKKDRE